MRPSIETIWGMRAMKRCAASDYVEWAVGMLESGFDSKHLRILAGLDSFTSTFETEQYFTKSLVELELPELSQERAIQAYAVYVARKICEGKIPAREGVKALFKLCVACKYPKDLAVWHYLDDWCADQDAWTSPTLPKEDVEMTIVRVAEEFVRAQGGQASEISDGHRPPLQP